MVINAKYFSAYFERLPENRAAVLLWKKRKEVAGGGRVNMVTIRTVGDQKLHRRLAKRGFVGDHSATKGALILRLLAELADFDTLHNRLKIM